MPTHVALLRGVNVGGHNRVPMEDLRRLAADLGLQDVATYVQSGNMVFSARGTTTKLAAQLRSAIGSQLSVDCDVVVLTRKELESAADANPFPVDDPKRLHLVFRDKVLTEAEVAAVEGAQAKASGRNRVAVVGATVYLDTPDGIGRSDLAARLGRLKGAGTARNWTTVTKLLGLLDS